MSPMSDTDLSTGIESTATAAPASFTPRGSRRDTAILVTGAGGEVGHGLISALHAQGRADVVAIDLRKLDRELRPFCQQSFVGDICDMSLLERLLAMYEITEIYHLAALLSTRCEYHAGDGPRGQRHRHAQSLRLAAEQARSHGQRVKFVFPSSIAVYGLPDLETKGRAGAVTEDQFLYPHTMYGCNKLYCEHLGRYYANYYRSLAQDRVEHSVDFRCLRFPGLISADTLPSGGTSDYGPEMIHAAAAGNAYACFVRPDTRTAFMTMPDAVDALLDLAAADEGALRQRVYNVTSFNPSAGEIETIVRRHFPAAEITFQPDRQRQAIVDSWPQDVDDSAARRDWGYRPCHDLTAAFDEYLVPRIKARYA